jgi:hypothetical protein
MIQYRQQGSSERKAIYPLGLGDGFLLVVLESLSVFVILGLHKVLVNLISRGCITVIIVGMNEELWINWIIRK